MDASTPVQNPIGFRDRLGAWKGSSVELDLRPYHADLAVIGEREAELRDLDDDTIATRAGALRLRVGSSAPSPGTMLEAFALTREAARRRLGLRPYDEQVVAALALFRGRVIEMQTGEGKTLAAVLPALAHALSGRGVHVLTVNDYLARRDAEWMGPVYRSLGVSVGWVAEGLSADERRRAYAADVTYVTAKEAGFDHLRDLLAMDRSALVHRPFHCAIVDEADSLLIDEARVPLVIAGHGEQRESSAERLARLVEALDPEIHYDTDEYGRNVELTEAGTLHVERILGRGPLHDEENYALLTELHCALHVAVLLRRDVDYLVRDGRIEVVDEFTGRVAEDRHWPDGLQAALEAKEGLRRGADGRILGSITLQHFLGAYPLLAGMTGTARDAARELREVYGKTVTVIPTHRPMIRQDHPDRVYVDRRAQEDAVVQEIETVHATRRPILVGTASVEASERLATRLARGGVPCRVLNAKNDALEAEIVARAGAMGSVTIATNMAGRGTDIRLGGEEASEKEYRWVSELGGLYVIGTHHNESPRIDRQLRGRAGRQGDPGESRFFVSLEDDMAIRFGIRDLIPARLVPESSSDPIENPVVVREVARVQRIVDGQNAEIRKTLLRYAEPVEDQRRKIHERRQAWLLGELEPSLWREHRPEARQRLVDRHGESTVRRVELAVTLFHVDRLWSEHLSWVADLREGNHLVGLAGEDPLTRFRLETAQAYHQLLEDLDAAVLETLETLDREKEPLDLERLGLRGPSSTWTYLVNDDPFRNQLSAVLSGPGNTTLTIGAALTVPFLLIAWAVVERFFRRRRT